MLVVFVVDAGLALDIDETRLELELDLTLDSLLVKVPDIELDPLLTKLPEVGEAVVDTLVRAMVVDCPLTTTCVMPLITVVRPDTEKLGFTGMVVRPPVRISSVVPPITVRP